MATLKQKYTEEVMPALKEALGLPNPMMIPKVSKVVVNMGLGCADKDTLKVATEQLAAVTGQRPVVRKAKKSISNFKLREGMAIGTKVTLRRQQMYDFLDRLINISLPRIRDFRGIPTTGFDGRGNYNMGLIEKNRGNIEPAAEHFAAVARFDPDDLFNPGKTLPPLTTT